MLYRAQGKYRVRVMILPILISFSRSVESDQYSASYDSVNVR